MSWRQARVAEDGSHHELDDRPLYEQRFDSVLPFHEPGLAPVQRGELGWHIRKDGTAAYAGRFQRAFGFYEGRAAIIDGGRWFHILPDGTELASTRYAWAGNFQGERCTVRTDDGRYHHIDDRGDPAYERRWRYAGDFRHGIAVVQREDGLSTHIRDDGRRVHDRWFLDLDVFHKGAARARDGDGWTHVDPDGHPLYERRFAAVEPFYNGQARVEGSGGELLVIDERGETVTELRSPRVTPLQRLSGQMVGFWRTQTIRAAVQLGVPEALPATTEECAATTGLTLDNAHRLLRALWELNLVRPSRRSWELTETGALLRFRPEGSAADAAKVWGDEHYAAWAAVTEALREDRCAYEMGFGAPFFERLASRPHDLRVYQRAMEAYARHDYDGIAARLPLDGVRTVIDAGGGRGGLLLSLLSDAPDTRGVLLERAEVAQQVSVPASLSGRMEVIEGDIFDQRWPCQADLVVLARVLHDWPDADAIRILRSASAALSARGRIAVVELTVNDQRPDGALLDLNMLVMCGSRERTRTEWDDLARHAGLKITSQIATTSYGAVLTLEPGTEPHE